MRRNLNCRDMILGAVIMLIGVMIGVTVSPLSIAQRNAVFQDALFRNVFCDKLVVTDKEGNPAITLKARDDGGADVYMWDDKGKFRIGLYTGERGAAITIYDSMGEGAISLFADNKGNNIEVLDKNNKTKWSTYDK